MIDIHCLGCKNITCQDIDNLDMMTWVRIMIRNWHLRKKSGWMEMDGDYWWQEQGSKEE